MCTDANFWETEKNQEVLAKAGALPPIMKLIQNDKTPELQLNSILLLFNISHCGTSYLYLRPKAPFNISHCLLDDGREGLTASDVRVLTPFVDAKRVYHTHVTQRETDVQIHIISVLGHAASRGKSVSFVFRYFNICSIRKSSTSVAGRRVPRKADGILRAA